MSNVEILETPRREYDADRDWLTPETRLRHSAEVVPFTPRLLICTICGGHTHRAASCPRRPRSQATD